eukprot:509348-Prymnesium_polylepis.1
MLLVKCLYCCAKLPESRFESRIVKGELKLYTSCIKCRPKKAKVIQKYDKSTKGKISKKKYADSDKGRVALKIAKSNYKKTEKYTEKYTIQLEKQKNMYKTKSWYKMIVKMRTSACRLVNFQIKKSKIFMDNSSFPSIREFVRHMKQS